MKNMTIRYSSGLLFAFLSLWVLVPILILSEDNVATALYKEGLKKYILEDYNGAVKDFDTAHRLNPEDIKIRKMYINTLIKLGNIEYENNNLKMAEKHFLKAYTLSGEDEDLQRNLETIQERLIEQKIERERLKELELATAQEDAAGTKEKLDVETDIAEEVKTEVVQLPFDMEEFIQNQNLENRKILTEIIEAQKTEREILLKNIEESQRLLDQNIKAQNEERAGLFKNIRENQNLLIKNVKEQQEERVGLIKNIEESQKLLDENIKAQQDDREMLFERMAENQKLLDESIKNQREERETFLNNLMVLAQSQSEDRKLFSRSLMTVVGGGIIIVIIFLMGFIFLFRRRTLPQFQAVYHEPQTELEFKSNQLLEYTEKLDETKFITDENYSDMVKAKRLRELYLEFQKGNPSWDVIKGYISELNSEVKSEILNVVEKKVKSGVEGGYGGVMETLIPFITDGDTDIRTRGKGILKNLAVEAGMYSEAEFLEKKMGVSEDPLSMVALLPIAKMVDAKTGRIDHSLNVADIAFRISGVLKDPDLDPETVMRVGLAHDIGFLEIPDKIMKTKGEITKRQFETIKTHTKKGINLLQHVALPDFFIDGIKYHHERLDGSGYPDGLESDSIPLIARILAVADVFDAVTSTRPHRPALSLGSCFEMMREMAGTMFDQQIFDILVGLYKDNADIEK
jgi:putative nucleotidyltransferase with HDIG domain